jgi:penicillin-binding protein 2
MKNDNESGSHIDRWRLFLFGGVVIFLIFVFVVRLFNLQILQNEEWVAQAEDNRTITISTPTQRGVIYDRNGILLAQNIPSYNIAITPALLPDEEGEIQEILRQLAKYLELPLHKGSIDDPLIQCGDGLGITEMVEIGLSFSPFTPVLIECDVDRSVALVISENAINWPGVSVEIEPIRDYPTGDLTSTYIGFLGPIPQIFAESYEELGFVTNRDKSGYAGLEYFFDEVLRGANGQRIVEVDVAGEVLRDVEAVHTPEDGLNLTLTIDMRLQQAANAIMEKEISYWDRYLGEKRYTSGVVIAMNPGTGEILAMVSWPSFENNRMSPFIPTYYYDQLEQDSTEPLVNHAVAAAMPAGSVFKLVTAVGALNEGVVGPYEIVKTPPKIVLKNAYTANNLGLTQEYVDWYDPGFGQLSMIGGISNSSNVYFYKVGGGYEPEIDEGGLGICRIGTYAKALGYGDFPGVELADEVKGLVPDPTWKRQTQGENWSTGDTYITSVGQGFIEASPLQVLLAAATVANNGVVIRPTLVKNAIDNEGNVVPLVIDQYGNLMDFTESASGELTVIVYDEDGNEINLLLMNSSQLIMEYPLQEFFDVDGDPIIPFVESPWAVDMKWDVTKDPVIEKYSNPSGIGSCKETGESVTVEPWVFDIVQQGMRQAVTDGTLEDIFGDFPIATAGKTGSAEYCDKYALEKGACQFGRWQSHAWTVAYAPYNDPEIVVVAFVYNGNEGATVAGPIVRDVIEAYFELKEIDSQQ